MRCKCCDNERTRYWAGDYYCQECRDSISETIAEQRWVDVDHDFVDHPLSWPLTGHLGTTRHRKTKVTLAKSPLDKEEKGE